jgi:predicted pyridoxine 5'-phosphate oxidase superfamily flavin-nucleotide-binding protein
MPRSFSSIAFTDSVKAAQEHYGSREAYRALDLEEAGELTLGPREQTFVEARDSAYQATVSETGWPYVQFRGGPPGFLKVLDSHSVGYADFRGNRQYLSVGNLRANDRVALILMDYPHRRRLKLWGRARVLEAEEDPALMARLELPDYRGRVERAVVIAVEAFDWNCPQHITPRFTEQEVSEYVAALTAEVNTLRAELSRTTKARSEAG